MAHEQLKPGEVATMYVEKRRIFFYERPNGTIIDVNERDAWKIHGKFKQVGVSDGSIHAEAVLNIRKNAKTLLPEQVNALLREALDKEIEAARGNLIAPRNTSVETFGNQKLGVLVERMAMNNPNG